MDKKEIRKLVELYFEYNPHNNKGVGFRAKANDIITSYATKHKMTYGDIKHCIESKPMCQEPVWDQFFNYWFKNNNNKKKEEKSEYKDSISDSTDPNDWL